MRLLLFSAQLTGKKVSTKIVYDKRTLLAKSIKIADQYDTLVYSPGL